MIKFKGRHFPKDIILMAVRWKLALPFTAVLERINNLIFILGLWHLLIEVRRIKYLNNMVEQDHRGIKNITKYTLGFKSFVSAEATIAGIELCRMLQKGQMENMGQVPAWKQFYEIAA